MIYIFLYTLTSTYSKKYLLILNISSLWFGLFWLVYSLFSVYLFEGGEKKMALKLFSKSHFIDLTIY